MAAIFRNLIRKTDGATAIEYGLLAALIAVASIAAFQSFGNGLGGMWSKVQNGVTQSNA